MFSFSYAKVTFLVQDANASNYSQSRNLEMSES